MEQSIAEWILKLSAIFWGTNRNPNLRKALEKGIKVSDIFDNCEKIYNEGGKIPPDEIEFYLRFIFLYEEAFYQEPTLYYFLEIIPWSYHKHVMMRFNETPEALSFLSKIIQYDWTEDEMISQLSITLN